MSLLRWHEVWHEGSDSDHATGLNRDTGLAGYRKIPAGQWAKLPRYWREWAVEVRPFTAKKKLRASEAQGLSGEAVKGNPTTRVIPGVDESKSSPRTNRRLDRTLQSCQFSRERLVWIDGITSLQGHRIAVDNVYYISDNAAIVQILTGKTSRFLVVFSSFRPFFVLIAGINAHALSGFCETFS